MSNFPSSAALHAPAASAQAAVAPSEQAERAGAAPSGAETFKAALRKELGVESETTAPAPSPSVPQDEVASDAPSPSADQTAQDAATTDATLAMLLHAQASAAAAQPAAQMVQAILSPGSLASPPGDPQGAPFQAKAGGNAPGWTTGVARKAAFDLAAAASASAQRSLADERPNLSSRLTGLVQSSDVASTVLGTPRQEFRLDAGADAALPAPSGLPGAAATDSPRSQSSTVVQTQIHARVGDAHWDQGLGERLVWMAGQRHQVAQLHLNPPDLGPLTITLTLERDQASAQFVCAQAAVREAIEAAMPRLRDMLAESGITLGNVDVGAQAFPEPPSQQQRTRRGDPGAAQSDADAMLAQSRPLLRGLGLVDTFA